MKAQRSAVFGPRFMPAMFMLAMLLATFASFAQESATDELLPSVDTSDFEPAVDTSAMEPAVDTSAMEPAVDTSAAANEDVADEDTAPAIAADVVRQQSGTQVMDRLELGRTEITGSQELPKVLYIVPWQKSDPGDLMGKPVNTLLDDVLAPLDREEFVRQVEYYDDLYGDNSE